MLRVMTDDEVKESDLRRRFLYASSYTLDNLAAILMDANVGGFGVDEEPARSKALAILSHFALRPGDEDPGAARPSAWSRSVPSEDGFWWLRAPGDGASVCRKVGPRFWLVGEDVALRAGDFLPTTEFARAEEPK